jgi:glycosyltransferase involved in cell wall biosynthesis
LIREPSGGKTKVVVITNIYAPYRVAAFQELARLVNLEVFFCARRGVGGLNWRIPDDFGFEHRFLDLRSVGTSRDYYFDPRLLVALHRSRPEVVISPGYSALTFYSALYCFLHHSRLIIISEGTAQSERALSSPQLISRLMLVRLAHAFLGTSREAAQRFRDMGATPSRIFISPYTTDLRRYWQVGARRSLGLEGRVRVVYVGRLVHQKGVEYLIRAVGIASRTCPNIDLTIVGSGAVEQELRDLVAQLNLSCVSFVGFVDQDELVRYYEAAEVFAFPTVDDPFGMVLIEAAASGLAIITSPYAGAVNDLTADGAVCIVLPPTDIERIAEALVSLARDPSRRLDMGNRAYRATLERTPLTAAMGYAHAISATLSNPPR